MATELNLNIESVAEASEYLYDTVDNFMRGIGVIERGRSSLLRSVSEFDLSQAIWDDQARLGEESYGMFLQTDEDRFSLLINLPLVDLTNNYDHKEEMINNMTAMIAYGTEKLTKDLLKSIKDNDIILDEDQTQMIVQRCSFTISVERTRYDEQIRYLLFELEGVFVDLAELIPVVGSRYKAAEERAVQYGFKKQ